MNNSEIRAKYRKGDIDALRRSIRVGDIIQGEIRYNRLGERLMAPIRVEHKVTAVYPFLVELETDGSRRRTATYTDILLGQVEGGSDV